MEQLPLTAASPVLTVSQLVRSVRDVLERRFPLQWVSGEISNCRPAASGHLYFVLKDENAQVDCVMYRSRAAALDWDLQEGQKVEARVLTGLYEPRGRFQLTVETMRRAGLGPLYERFLRLKDKLEREGLFDPAAKHPVPDHPRCIGVVTSLAAAALRDVLTCLKRRNPAIPVVVYPAPVQGEGAAVHLGRAIARANARGECDVLLLVRGGGSIEDLWQFNEEVLARAIHASDIPVVSGVGHETDFTIADFAADERCPTPTAAAERVSPSQEALLERISALAFCVSKEMSRKLSYGIQTVDMLQRRLVHPAARLRASEQHLAHLAVRLSRAMAHRFAELLAQVKHAKAGLAAFDHPALLARGYSVTRNSKGEIIRDASRVAEGEHLATTLARGWIESKVTGKGA